MLTDIVEIVCFGMVVKVILNLIRKKNSGRCEKPIGGGSASGEFKIIDRCDVSVVERLL